MSQSHSPLSFPLISDESPSRLGPPLVDTTTSEVTVQRPDKLRGLTPGDGPASEFDDDGTTLVAFAPADRCSHAGGGLRVVERLASRRG